MLNIVLYEPEMPMNTGNIGRSCVATNTRLHLIEPLGFKLNDKMVKRAGLDYWPHLDVTVYSDFKDFLEKNPARARIWRPRRRRRCIRTFTTIRLLYHVRTGKPRHPGRTPDRRPGALRPHPDVG